LGQLKERIESFVGQVTKNKDHQLLDILWIFSYCLPSKSGYHKKQENKQKFKKWLGRICIRNLQKKYSLKPIEARDKIKVFAHFLDSIPGFFSKETFDEDKNLFKEILVSKSSKILVEDIKMPGDLSDLDKKILSFVLNYIPIRIQDSIKQAEKFRQHYPDKYYPLSDFFIRTDEETGSIRHFEIDPGRWTYIFNPLFDEELKEYKYKEKLSQGISLPPKFWQYGEYSFWQLGDELAKIGTSYWTFYISAKGKVSINLIIPNFIYEGVESYRTSLPIVKNLREKIAEIKKEKEVEIVEKAWGLEELIEENMEESREVLESEIEASIISNPEVLEEGLELIGNQYSTPVGNIDILYRDKSGSFVVVELKKGKGSYDVVGQIQKYMAWVSENLAEDKQVRGIIVVKEYDKELEYAVKGSRFLVEIRSFGKAPPIKENIRYCDRCGKPNKESAKYCVKCGQQFWM